MTNFEDLKCCINECEENVAVWLTDFIYNMFDYVISEDEVTKYLDSQYDNEEGQDMSSSDSMKQKRRNDGLHKKKLKKIWEATGGAYYHPFGYYPVDKHGNYTNDADQIAYYKRYDSPHKRTKFLKRQSNKKIRSMNSEEALKGGTYKKLFDYWWELY